MEIKTDEEKINDTTKVDVVEEKTEACSIVGLEKQVYRYNQKIACIKLLRDGVQSIIDEIKSQAKYEVETAGTEELE